MKKSLKKDSIILKISVPLTIVMVFQSFLFVALIVYGGTLDFLNKNAMDILNERVINRKNYIENEMIQRWSNLDECESKINEKVDKILQSKQLSYDDLQVGNAVTNEVLYDISSDLIYMMRRNVVNGAFVIFHGNDNLTIPVDNSTFQKAGIHIRDLDSSSNPVGNSDLLIERSPASVSKRIGISMDSNWSAYYTISKDNLFYFNSLHAANTYPGVNTKDLGYWSNVFYLSPNDHEVLTYTQPLLTPDGKFYGVIGVELTSYAIRQNLPYEELNGDKNGIYSLGVLNDELEQKMVFNNAVVSGPMYKHLFGTKKNIELFSDSIYDYTHRVVQSDNRDDQILSSIHYLNIYNTNTPFSNQRWVLIGLLPENDLFSFSNLVKNSMLFTVSAGLLFGITGLLLVSYAITKPIALLADDVREIDPNKQNISLKKTKVAEIDELSSSIESLSKNIAASSSKLTNIIEMTSLPIGAFEYDRFKPYYYCSKNFLQLIDLEELSLENFSKEKLLIALEKLHEFEYENNGETKVYRLQLTNGNIRYLRLKEKEDESLVTGVLTDITAEVLEKRNIEYERDYDLLTKIYNRRAFHKHVKQLFRSAESLKISALVMLDLDNLKYINDTYGHDIGDDYLNNMAKILKTMETDTDIVARMSGDEFFVFFSGYETVELLTLRIRELKNKINDHSSIMPDGKVIRMRASAGVAWYPKDSMSLQDLIKYADFAMYEVKHSAKGNFKDFEIESYQQNAFMLHGREELNKILEYSELLTFALQPIIDAKSATVYAYEALMRPKSEILLNPLDVLKIARSQSKLYEVEKSTFFSALKKYVSIRDQLEGRKLFINSIPNQILNDNDMKAFKQQYNDYLHEVVVEFTESDAVDFSNLRKKVDSYHVLDMKVALDDFGTGFNSDGILLEMKPDYIKIDINIIRNIDSDRNRQEIYLHLSNFAKERGIKVLAEGVETLEEMTTLVQFGVDYIQGYYFAKLTEGVPVIDESSLEELKNCLYIKSLGS